MRGCHYLVNDAAHDQARREFGNNYSFHSRVPDHFTASLNDSYTVILQDIEHTIAYGKATHMRVALFRCKEARTDRPDTAPPAA